MTLALVWAALNRLFTDYVVNQYVTEMTALSDSLTASASVRGGKIVITGMPSDPRLNLPAGGRYWALEQNGIILNRSRSFWDQEILQANFRPSEYRSFQEGVGPDGKQILLVSQYSTLGDGKRIEGFRIYTAFPKSELTRALTSFNGELVRMLLVTAALLVLAAIVQAIVGLSPLDRVRRKVTEIRRGNILRMSEEGPIEVRPLVREIDLLLEERESAIERARSRASDLAHGLKTPLTVISQLAAKMEPDAAEMALKQVDLIRQRADRQLQAARLGVERMTSTDVGELTSKLIHVLKPVHGDRNVGWQFDVTGDVRVEADPADLAEALGNVLDNASKWARSKISVAVARNGLDVIVQIADDGPGIPEGDQRSVIVRGQHSSDTNGGSGLGLAIAADITNAYGAALTLERASLGGLEVTIRIPVKSVRTSRASNAS
jgi:signal transduction histidine kinase